MRKWHVVLGIVSLTAMAVFLGVQSLRSNAIAPQEDFPQDAGLRKPRVVLKETSRDMGTLDPEDKCSHVFIVKNEGDAPLKLAKAGTSCKCTVSMLPSGDIPPGKGGPIEVESKNDAGEGPFSHTASFLTNDPDMPRIELTIQGDVRRHLVMNPPTIHLPDLKRNQPVEMSTLILSEAWESFSLENVKTSIDGLNWDFQPASPEKLQEFKAKSGYLATFRLPRDRSRTDFAGWLQADAQPMGKPESSRKLNITLSGRAAPIRSVFGPCIDADGVVTVGTLNRGQGARVPLVLQVRGEHREIQVQKIEKTPEFMKVTVEPQSPELAKKGVYRIIIEIPPDAPSCTHKCEDNMGEVRVLTDHPDMPEIVSLKVSFAVLSD